MRSGDKPPRKGVTWKTKEVLGAMGIAGIAGWTAVHLQMKDHLEKHNSAVLAPQIMDILRNNANLHDDQIREFEDKVRRFIEDQLSPALPLNPPTTDIDT